MVELTLIRGMDHLEIDDFMTIPGTRRWCGEKKTSELVKREVTEPRSVNMP